jgi:gas vesicle structural protein
MNSSSEFGTPTASDELVEPRDSRRVSLCEALDRMLNTGVVVAGEVVISVADIDLVYLNVQLLLTSIETACRIRRTPAGVSPLSPSEP